ncbi:MAG: pyridoxamine 5'-phosphate oxidase family protein [Thermoleophilaceae bacterium]
MPSRREQIEMSGDELRAFLAERKIVSCATLGPRGRPHLVPLWYVPDGTVLRGWTYAKSQKARNLERDPHATLQVEDGVAYDELRGAMLECDVELERDPDRVIGYGVALFERYTGGELDDGTRAAVGKQAPKRIGLTFRPTRIVTWDHSKLGGGY